MGLEWGPLSLVSTTEELLGRNSKGSSLESWEYGCWDPLHWPRNTLHLQKLALTSPTSGSRSVGILCLRTKATELLNVNDVCSCKWGEHTDIYIHNSLVTFWTSKFTILKFKKIHSSCSKLSYCVSNNFQEIDSSCSPSFFLCYLQLPPPSWMRQGGGSQAIHVSGYVITWTLLDVAKCPSLLHLRSLPAVSKCHEGAKDQQHPVPH
jgi:hypothetical protein